MAVLQREILLHVSTDEVWRQVKTPRLFIEVSRPFLTITPLDFADFPETWEERRYRVALHLFGLIPLGWQVIAPLFPEPRGERRLLDAGHGALVRKWHHEISVIPNGEATLYRERLEIDAGWLTPLVMLFTRLFFVHRHHRLARIFEVDATPC